MEMQEQLQAEMKLVIDELTLLSAGRAARRQGIGVEEALEDIEFARDLREAMTGVPQLVIEESALWPLLLVAVEKLARKGRLPGWVARAIDEKRRTEGEHNEQ